MRPATWLAVGGFGLALLAAGCQKLNVEHKLTLSGIEPSRLDIDPPQYEQKLTVEVDSPGAPLTACVVKTDEADAAAQALMRHEEPKGAFGATKAKSEKVNLEATVPAKTAYSVLVMSDGKRAEVNVKIRGR